MEFLDWGWQGLQQAVDLDHGPWQRPVLALLLLAVFLLGRRLLTHWLLWPLLGGLSRLLRVERARLDGVLRDPATLVPVVAGIYLAAHVFQFDDWVQEVILLVLRSIGVFGTTLLMARALKALAAESRVLTTSLGEEIVTWGVRLLEILVWLLGVAAILEVWGVQVAPLIASLGILGVAVALGAQDFFRNLISGLVVLSEKRYRRGDRVQLAGVVDGSVERIGFRSTRVRLFDGAPVSVPNATLSDGALVNYGEIPWRRVLWTITLEYGTSAAQLVRIRDEIREYLRDCGDFVPGEEATQEVRLDKFANSSIDIMIYAFANTNEWAPWLEVKERLLLRVKEIVEGAGASFAFPSRSIYIEKGAPAPEGTPGSGPGG